MKAQKIPPFIHCPTITTVGRNAFVSSGGYFIMEKETWKEIKGYEKSHLISNFGRVKSLSRKIKCKKYRTSREKILKNVVSGKYYHIQLKNKDTYFLIHRLVGLHFIPNPKNKPCINHINGNGHDNRVNNLEWVTYSENEKHSYRVLGKKPWNKGIPGNPPWNKGVPGKKLGEHPGAKKIAQYDKEGNLIKIHSSIKGAAIENNILPSQIWKSAIGRFKTYKKWKWEYV